MNSKIMDILITTENFSKEINFYNKIDEFLTKEEIVYDGNVISAYEIEKILKNRMNYIKELCNPSNYIFNEEEFLNMLKKVYLFHPKKNEKIDKINIRLCDVRYAIFSYGRYNKQSFARYLFSISTNNSNKLSFDICKCFDEEKIYYSGARFFEYTEEDIYNWYSGEYNSDYIKKFILDNKEILNELFFVIQDIYNGIENSFSYYATNFCNSFEFDDWKVNFIFNLNSNSNICNLTCSDDTLSNDAYFDMKRKDILKRISININELNPLFRNEIDKHYNSINSIDYKCYKRKK